MTQIQYTDFRLLVEFCFRANSILVSAALTDRSFPIKLEELKEINKSVVRCNDYLDEIGRTI